MYNPHHGEDDHPGYQAKRYGAHAGTEEILEKEHYHGQEKDELSYEPKNAYNPHGDNKDYQTGAGDDEEKKKDNTEFEELLKEEEKKEEEEPWFQATTPAGFAPPQEDHPSPHRSVEEIISKAFKRKSKGDEDND